MSQAAINHSIREQLRALKFEAGRIRNATVTSESPLEVSVEGGDAIPATAIGDTPGVGDVVYVVMWGRRCAVLTGPTGATGPTGLQTAPCARVYNSANISHATSGSWQALTFNSERYDNDTIHSTSSNTGRLTATTAGVYSITASVAFSSNATGIRGLAIRVNGADVAQHLTPALNGFNTVMTIAGEYKLAATGYVELAAFQNSGGALNVLNGGNYSPEFAMHKVSDG